MRIVAANAFRVAKNIGRFIPEAEAVLGFPTETIAGRGEVRLTYTGVVHILPPGSDRVLVIDIGDDSTEFVTGSDLRPAHTESLPLGCVIYSMCFFQNKIGSRDFQTTAAAARNEI